MNNGWLEGIVELLWIIRRAVSRGDCVTIVIGHCSLIVGRTLEFVMATIPEMGHRLSFIIFQFAVPSVHRLFPPRFTRPR